MGSGWNQSKFSPESRDSEVPDFPSTLVSSHDVPSGLLSSAQVPEVTPVPRLFSEHE